MLCKVLDRGRVLAAANVSSLAGRAASRSDANMLTLFAHITPLEAPILWFAFAAGIAVGAFATWFVMSRRAARSR
jgi:hypothetical protein